MHLDDNCKALLHREIENDKHKNYSFAELIRTKKCSAAFHSKPLVNAARNRFNHLRSIKQTNPKHYWHLHRLALAKESEAPPALVAEETTSIMDNDEAYPDEHPSLSSPSAKKPSARPTPTYGSPGLAAKTTARPTPASIGKKGAPPVFASVEDAIELLGAENVKFLDFEYPESLGDGMMAILIDEVNHKDRHLISKLKVSSCIIDLRDYQMYTLSLVCNGAALLYTCPSVPCYHREQHKEILEAEVTRCSRTEEKTASFMTDIRGDPSRLMRQILLVLPSEKICTTDFDTIAPLPPVEDKKLKRYMRSFEVEADIGTKKPEKVKQHFRPIHWQVRVLTQKAKPLLHESEEESDDDFADGFEGSIHHVGATSNTVALPTRTASSVAAVPTRNNKKGRAVAAKTKAVITVPKRTEAAVKPSPVQQEATGVVFSIGNSTTNKNDNDTAVAGKKKVRGPRKLTLAEKNLRADRKALMGNKTMVLEQQKDSRLGKTMDRRKGLRDKKICGYRVAQAMDRLSLLHSSGDNNADDADDSIEEAFLDDSNEFIDNLSRDVKASVQSELSMIDSGDVYTEESGGGEGDENEEETYVDYDYVEIDIPNK